ncbi:MAG: DUF547 domain-containing protein [Acidobacteriia bacterium]|nr:DUF547 domain-containing protein [Terriglobia bacterium]
MLALLYCKDAGRDRQSCLPHFCSILLACLFTAQAWSAELDHAPWDALIRKHVNAQACVDYRRWKAEDIPALDTYLGSLAAPWPTHLSALEHKAASINAYNALVIRWILTQYPTKSIWKSKKPFATPRHIVNGKKVSLDDIENGLRDLGDPRVHAVLVCAARSCPPLRREAYTAARLDEQMDSNARAWLANPALNRFFPDRKTAEISSIFDWFKADFQRNGGTVEQFLARFAPAEKAAFLKQGKVKLKYIDYHWGLNDTTLGADYSKAGFLWDWTRNR